MIRMQSLTSATFQSKVNNHEINDDYIYFLTDTKQIYKGEVAYGANPDLYENITENLLNGLNNIEDTLNGNSTIKNAYITIANNHTLNNSFTTTANNVNYYIMGNNCQLTISNNFNFSGNYNEFNNIVFNVNNLTGGITTITKNTVFKNCKFYLTNSKAFTITLNAGCSVEFINCYFVGNGDILNIVNTSASAFRMTNITNCIMNGTVKVNSTNPEEVVNITYTKGITINENESNQADIYDMTEPIFNTVEIVGGD